MYTRIVLILHSSVCCLLILTEWYVAYIKVHNIQGHPEIQIVEPWLAEVQRLFVPKNRAVPSCPSVHPSCRAVRVWILSRSAPTLSSSFEANFLSKSSCTTTSCHWLAETYTAERFKVNPFFTSFWWKNITRTGTCRVSAHVISKHLDLWDCCWNIHQTGCTSDKVHGDDADRFISMGLKHVSCIHRPKLTGLSVLQRTLTTTRK